MLLKIMLYYNIMLYIFYLCVILKKIMALLA